MTDEASLDILTERMPPLPGSVLAGVSGGADSVALLLLLARRRAVTPGTRLYAVHVNHGLRGEASDGDEAFTRSLCLRLDVPLLVYRASPPEHPSEDWARQARYGFFREAMRETGCDALCLAHHMDDQAETLLLHLLRGAGAAGLTGMAPRAERDGMVILRPLLGFRRAELRALLQSLGEPWREDASNSDPVYLRNAVRHRLLPLMEELNPRGTEHLARAAELLRSDEAFLAAETERYLGKRGDCPWLPLTDYEACPQPLRSRLLRTWWQRCAGAGLEERTLSAAQTERFLAAADGPAGGSCPMPGRRTALRGWSCLHLIPPGGVPALPDTEIPVGPDGAVLDGITLRAAEGNGEPGDGRTAQAWPLPLPADLVLRRPRPGDSITPFGRERARPLNDYLARQRVDAPFRSRIPVVCRGSEVLLVCGVGAGRVPPFDPDRPGIRFIWQGDMPWSR